ncbi:MAG: M23 family metallopeptidase [Actinomycetota bacterium]|nr:M23 family metallopeptidase [Actinomycetota bacterium]
MNGRPALRVRQSCRRARLLVGVAGLLAWSLLASATGSSASGRCLPPPVPGPIAVSFQQPSCPYCAGHRGIEYHVAVGTPVHAVQQGVVTFAGTVAGTIYVVVLQPDGLRATYGLVLAPAVRRGAVVAQGQVVGHATGRVYFGLRATDDSPVDPTPLLGRWVGRPRLVPLDDTPPRPPPPPHLTCAAAAET